MARVSGSRQAPIRNALAVIDIAGADPQRIDWACRIINRQTQHLERLVDDLLDTARITRGLVQLKTAPVDLRTVLQEAVESTAALVHEREHDLELELPEAPVVAHGDLTRLVQIVTNLINNAAKYTDRRGSIRLSLVQKNETAQITVQDNGRGITREDLPVIFDVFSQGRQSLARAEGGLGLGLPLVRKLVELHGGTVEVASDGAGQSVYGVAAREPRAGGPCRGRRAADRAAAGSPCQGQSQAYRPG
jgi:signal transduction histidine kinase